MEPLTKTNGVESVHDNKTPKKKVAKKSNNKSSKPVRSYPLLTFENALIVPQKIKELNGGKPWPPSEVAEAANTRNTNKIFYLLASSRDFGFTTGTNTVKEIALTELGRAIVYAPNPEIERRKKIEAFLKIPIFKNVLAYYNGSELPEMKYLANTLEDKFKLDPSFHNEFLEIFTANCKYLNITTGSTVDEILSDSEKNSGLSTIIVSETVKGSNNKLKAFVIMPFTEKNEKRPTGFFLEVLDSLLAPAGLDAGFIVATAIRNGSDIIQSTIINELLEADLVIADLTDHNPNVMFELGVRMMANKPVVLIKTQDTGNIFDIDNMLRVYEYDQNLWSSTLKKDIPKLIEHFKGAWDNRNSEQTYIKILRKEAQKS